MVHSIVGQLKGLVGYAWNTIPDVLEVIKTMGPATWAEKAATGIGQCLPTHCAHLDGWTEFRIVNEIELAQFVAIAAEAAEYTIVLKYPVPHIKEYNLAQLSIDPKW